MREKIVAGNWKMNNTLTQSKELVEELNKSVTAVSLASTTRVLIAPSFVNLQSCLIATQDTKIEVIAQNVNQHNNGAYTGEVSVEMLMDVGIKTVIVGHSERRAYYQETDSVLKEKVTNAIQAGLEVVFCFGENLEDREDGAYFEVIKSQLQNVLFHLEEKELSNLILAYEPVWAIGTGKTATAEQAQEVHAFVRNLFADKYGKAVSETISILYGGSVKPINAKEIFSKPDVDGGLIGGASLKSDDFTAIVEAI